jgi:nucleoside-diphosphate-sugar epimerase
VARILAIVPDLMLSSRVTESLRSAGHDVVVMQSLPDSIEAEALVCDLDAVDADEIARAGVPTLGFYSHVDIKTKETAEAAGVDLVVPRSRMARELPQLVDRLLG